MSEVMEAVAYLREMNLISLVLRLLLAVVGGGVIGYERGKDRQAAGLRTHILVCVGSACVMMVGQYIYLELGQNTDPARIGAQVVSGIGFIGAGTIILNSRHQVKGVTTAAGLWASAAMGLAAGVGYYECAVLMCVVLHVTLKGLNWMDEHYVKVAEDAMVYIEYQQAFHFSEVVRVLKENGWQMVSMETFSVDSENNLAVEFVMRGQDEKRAERDLVLEKIREMDAVEYIEEI